MFLRALFPCRPDSKRLQPTRSYVSRVACNEGSAQLKLKYPIRRKLRKFGIIYDVIMFHTMEAKLYYFDVSSNSKKQSYNFINLTEITLKGESKFIQIKSYGINKRFLTN